MSPKSPHQLTDESGVVHALQERDLAVATDLGKYRLLGELGTGGMADVYLAVADGPEGFRKLCVLKLLKERMAQDEDYRAMFLDEARLAARLNHPNVVQTFEVGETHGRLMIAMEYIEGQPVTRVRRRLQPEQFPLTATISVLCDVLDALEYAHQLTDFDGSLLGIVHRDVSPHNIILGYDGRVKLVDFGIAKSSAAMQETQAGVLKGKVGYMAPEQASMRDVDGRADVFSVGVILWEAIAGRRLTEGVQARDVLLRRIEGTDPRIIDIVPNVDSRLAWICDKAMAPHPDDRFTSAAVLQAELESWMKEHGEPSRKELSRTMREAFSVEREQLRTLVEQRMADSSNMSGMRQSLGTSSSNRAILLGEPSISVTAHKPPPSTVSVMPPSAATAARRSGPALVIAGVAVSVVLGVAATVYVATTTRGPTAEQPPAHAVVTPPPAVAPADPLVILPVDPPAVSSTTTQTAPPTAAAAPFRGRPVFVAPPRPPGPPLAHPPVASPPPVSTGATTSGLTPLNPSKTPTRPLDEKDPYAQ